MSSGEVVSDGSTEMLRSTRGESSISVEGRIVEASPIGLVDMALGAPSLYRFLKLSMTLQAVLRTHSSSTPPATTVAEMTARTDMSDQHRSYRRNPTQSHSSSCHALVKRSGRSNMQEPADSPLTREEGYVVSAQTQLKVHSSCCVTYEISRIQP